MLPIKLTLAHDTRDQIVDYVNRWNERTEIPAKQVVAWLGVGGSKFFDWKKRYGKVNEHNGQIPRDFWLEDAEKKAILDFHSRNPLEGYRRLTFMMLDADVVAVSPSSVYRVLREAGVMDRFHGKPSKKGTGFQQPVQPHEHWHIDVSYLNICGTFYFMCGILDGCSRSIIHWEIREQMQEIDVEVILQRAPHKRSTSRGSPRAGWQLSRQRDREQGRAGPQGNGCGRQPCGWRAQGIQGCRIAPRSLSPTGTIQSPLEAQSSCLPSASGNHACLTLRSARSQFG